MLRKRLVGVILSVLGVAVVVFLLSGIYSKADYFVGAEESQSISTVQSLSYLPPNEKRILVIYKEHCKTCKAVDQDIVKVLKNYKDKTYYVNVEDEMPSVVSLVLEGVPESNRHTPVVVVLESAAPGFYIHDSISVNSKEKLKELETMLSKDF